MFDTALSSADLVFLAKGAGMTIVVTAISVAIGTVLGILFGVIRVQLGAVLSAPLTFFLDIFQLHVQAGGDLNDSIDSYRAIYGNDPIGRELAILQESYPSFGVADSFDRLRNRVGNVDLKNVIGELAQKIRVGANLEQTLAQQSEDMRELREELAAKRANELNAKFNFPVVLATVATFLIFLSPAIALIYESGFL